VEVEKVEEMDEVEEEEAGAGRGAPAAGLCILLAWWWGWGRGVVCINLKTEMPPHHSPMIDKTNNDTNHWKTEIFRKLPLAKNN
jgi:hypothetical protein